MKKMHIRIGEAIGLGNICCLVALLSCLATASAQVLVIGPTNSVWSWRNNPADPGYSPADAWTAPGFDDSSWQTGRGLFGQETTAYPYPINTAVPAPASGGGVSAYFRTHFNWSGATEGVNFRFTNFVDDGILVYLNGIELFSFNMPTERPVAWNNATLPNGANPGGEPVTFLTNVVPTSLMVGDNVLAVQLQQQGTGSSDDVFGLSLLATAPAPIAITAQPTNTVVREGRTASFTVAFTGSNPLIQWYKDTTASPITDATTPTLTISNATLSDNGDYFVIINNNFNTVTSSLARLTVNQDTNGPTLLAAVGNVGGDQVTLTFSEPLDIGTGGENSNYEVLLTTGGGDLLVSLATITNGSNVVLTLDPSTPRNPGENYSVRISFVTDPFGNLIVPNPTIRPIAPEVVLVASDGTHPWRYDESGTDLAGFEAINFNDAAWPTAPSTFTQTGGETVTLPEFIDGTGGASSQILTPRSAGGPVTTYFRTHFSLPADPSNATVSVGYIVDDGAIVYLNGTEIHRIRMPAGVVPFNVDANVNAPEPPALVGPIVVATSNLVAGDNVIAIEVHQNGATSSDVVMGLRVTAVIREFASGPPSITSQPQSLTVTAGQSAGFSVGVTGGLPFTYQWRRNGVAIPGATSSSYSIPITTTADAGTYTVAITNSAGGVVSAGATLTVNPDTSVLTVVSVSGNLNFTNFTVTFSERVGASASNAANYRVALTNGSGALTVISAVVNNNTNVILTTSTPRSSGQAYSITISNVADLGGNTLVPNPTVLSIPADTILLPFDGTWKYFLGATTNASGGTTNGDLTGTGWQAPGYDDSAWLLGPGGLGHESDSGSTNPPVGLPGNNAVPIRTHIDYMSNSVPIYFRARFTLSSTTGITLNLRDVVEDGAIYYLNGQEAFRNNVNATSAVNFAIRAVGGATDPTPVTGPFSLPTTNLVVGDNVIAVQLVQSGNTSSDAEFAAELSIRGGATTPTGPRIDITYNDSAHTVTLTWNAPGYRLQETDALGSPTVWVNSTRVSGTPFTPTGNRFYRLISP